MTPTKLTPRRRLALGTAAVLAVAGLTACSSASASSPGSETTTIRYQGAEGSVNPIELGEALGYFPGLTFKKEGDVTGGPESLEALESNQIDISSGAFYGAIAQLVATGAPIKAVVATYGSDSKENEILGTLASAGISKPADLIGKKIAVNTLGGNEEAFLDVWLKQKGFTADQIKQITLVPLPPLNTLEALEKKQVDAAFLTSPEVVSAKAAGVDVATLITDTDVFGPYSGGGAAMATAFLQKNPTTSDELVTGVAKAVDYIQTHSKAQVLAIYVKWLKANGYQSYVQPVEEYFNGDLGVDDPHGVIAGKDISRWLGWLAGRGDVDSSKVTASDVYTNAYNAFAPGYSGAAVPSGGASQ